MSRPTNVFGGKTAKNRRMAEKSCRTVVRMCNVWSIVGFRFASVRREHGGNDEGGDAMYRLTWVTDSAQASHATYFILPEINCVHYKMCRFWMWFFFSRKISQNYVMFVWTRAPAITYTATLDGISKIDRATGSWSNRSQFHSTHVKCNRESLAAQHPSQLHVTFSKGQNANQFTHLMTKKKKIKYFWNIASAIWALGPPNVHASHTDGQLNGRIKGISLAQFLVFVFFLFWTESTSCHWIFRVFAQTYFCLFSYGLEAPCDVLTNASHTVR